MHLYNSFYSIQFIYGHQWYFVMMRKCKDCLLVSLR